MFFIFKYVTNASKIKRQMPEIMSSSPEHSWASQPALEWPWLKGLQQRCSTHTRQINAGAHGDYHGIPVGTQSEFSCIKQGEPHLYHTTDTDIQWHQLELMKGYSIAVNMELYYKRPVAEFWAEKWYSIPFMLPLWESLILAMRCIKW